MCWLLPIGSPSSPQCYSIASLTSSSVHLRKCFLNATSKANGDICHNCRRVLSFYLWSVCFLFLRRFNFRMILLVMFTVTVFTMAFHFSIFAYKVKILGFLVYVVGGRMRVWRHHLCLKPFWTFTLVFTFAILSLHTLHSLSFWNEHTVYCQKNPGFIHWYGIYEGLLWYGVLCYDHTFS